MDAVSYPQAAVIDSINDYVVAVRVPADHAELGPKFRIKWTPTLVFVDTDGVEHHRSLGFVAPEELPALVLLGVGKAHFNRAERQKAAECFDRIAQQHPRTFVAPEAVYLRGVSRYIESHDGGNLIAIYDTMT